MFLAFYFIIDKNKQIYFLNNGLTMADEIFNKNFEKLQQYNSKLTSDLLSYQGKNSYQIALDQGKNTTLLIDGRQLTTHHGREEFAKIRCKKLNLKSLITIYGFGLGDELRYLLKRNVSTKIQVVLLNPCLFLELLAIDDELYTLFEKNVEFVLPTDDDYPLLTNSIIVTSELYIDPKTFNHLKFKLINSLDNDFAIREFKSKVKPLIDGNLKENYELLKSENLLCDSDLSFECDNCIVIASGPSLEKNINRLKESINSKTIVITVDTALPTLEKYNIIPNIIVTTDARVYEGQKKLIFSNLNSYLKTMLVFSAHSQKELIELFKGKRRFIFKDSDTEILNYLDKSKSHYIKYYGSVLNESVAIALKTKAKLIKLFGADFAYEGDTTHSGIQSGIAVCSDDTKMRILCNDGRMQKTLRNFVVYKEYLENEIKNNKTVVFENYSKTGAIIKGAVLK